MSDVPFQHPGPVPPRPEVPEGVVPGPPPPPPVRRFSVRDLAAFPWWTPIAAFVLAIVATFVVMQFVTLFAQAAGAEIDQSDWPPGVIIVASILQGLFMAASAVLLASVTGPRPTAHTFGFRHSRFWRGVGLAALAGATFYLFSLVYTLVFDVTQKDNLPGELGAKDSTLNLVAVMFMVLIVAPVGEELFFRGFCFPAFSTALGWVGGAIASGVFFGAIHIFGTDLVFIVPLMVFGVLLALLYRFTGSILPCIGLHAFNNGGALWVFMDWGAEGLLVLFGAPLATVLLALPLARRTRPALA